MTIYNQINVLLLITMFLFSCQEDDADIGEITAPDNLEIQVDIVGADADNPNGDGSGLVNVSADADHAISYKFVTDGVEKTSSTGSESFIFSQLGVNTYEIMVIAYGTGGVSTSQTTSVDVLATYSPPQELVDKLIGDGSKTWRIKAEKGGHFGLGPIGGNIPTEFYGAAPQEKADVGMYDDRYIFYEDRTFEHITNTNNDDQAMDPSGTIFGRDGLVNEIGSGGTVVGADVLNVPYSDYQGTWQLIAPGGQETINLSDDAFIGYYTGGNHQYQIVDRSVPGELLLRTTDGNNEFDWWFILTSDEEEVEPDLPDFENLVWSDEFDGDALNEDHWNYEIGTGDNGWGNGEQQYYTDREDNVQVNDGTLKIIAKKESFEGSEYTSARITTKDKFEFTYGRVEISAKMAGGGGTWPALWMLGANFDEVGWPQTGEIDIMEYVGNNPDQVSAAVHYPDNFAGNAPTSSTSVENAESEFHLYECIWTSDVIKMFVDGEEFFSIDNDESLPFNKDFFFIFNVAMGGTLGGDIDPDFDTSTMEVDYIKVYQE